MKIACRSRVLLSEALGRDDTICCLLSTGRPPNDFEREQMAASGCSFLSGSANTVNWVRFHPRDTNLIVNLGFVEEIEVLER